jgi:hypothetical protein
MLIKEGTRPSMELGKSSEAVSIARRSVLIVGQSFKSRSKRATSFDR